MTQRAALGELFRVGSSKRVLKSQWQSEGVPFYRGREVTRLATDGFVENELFISESLYEEFASQNGVPDADDIMVTAIGTIGNSYVVRKGDRFYFKDASVLWLKKTAEVNSEFINYWLKSDEFFGQLDRGNGATVDTLSIQKLQSLDINLPALPEQRRIVAILDDAFERIATAKANAERNLKSSRELLTDHSDRLFTGGVSDWSELPLEAVASIKNGFAFKSADFTSSVGVKCIKITNVGVGEFVQTVGDLLPLDFSDKYAAFEARKGNIVLALTRAIIATGLKVAVVPDGYDKALVNQRVAAIAPSPDRVSAEFLSTYLSTRRVREYVEDRVITLMQPNLSILDLRSLPVPVPNMSIQRRLLQSLAILRQEVETAVSIYRRKIAALDELKKSLLHQAFSGVL